MTEHTGLNINVPKEYNGQNVVFRIQESKQKDTTNFRSFAVPKIDKYLVLENNGCIPMDKVIAFLQERGLSKTIPITMTIGVDGECKIKDIDWNPLGYKRSSQYYFTWMATKCSIISSNKYKQPLYFRVHDTTPGVGERVMAEIFTKLYELRVISKNNDTDITIYTTKNNWGYRWQAVSKRLLRPLDTIYINNQLKTKLIKQLEKFYSSRAMYERYGVTWKRVHLFHGPPGTGKTSTVLAIASHFKQNIAKFTLTPGVSSQDIETLFTTVPQDTIMVLEDIDALFTGRNAEQGVDFSTILNCIDGIATTNGLVLFMTTNHLEKLDQALIRPGRIDMTAEFGYPTRPELEQALKSLAPQYSHEHEEFLDTKCDGLSIAGLQAHIFDRVMMESDTIL